MTGRASFGRFYQKWILGFVFLVVWIATILLAQNLAMTGNGLAC